MTEGVVPEGKRLIEQWLGAQRRTAQAELNWRDCTRDEREAETALATWLAPSDAKPGEKIAVWYGNSLIQVEVGGVVSGEGDGPQHVSTSRVSVRLRVKQL